MVERLPTARKQVHWVGSARKDLRAFPEDVRSVMGVALFYAQLGGKHVAAKILRGHPEFRGASVFEIVDDFNGNTYHAVYTLQFKGIIYVLHAFQKKSKKGIATSLSDIRLIKQRIKIAREHYGETYEAKRAG